VVSLGDHFVAAQPNRDYPMGGSVINWAKSLNEILKLDFDTAIPGHGNDPLTKADVQAFRQKMQLIADRGIALVKKGVAKEEIRQQIQSPELGMWQMTSVINDARLDAFLRRPHRRQVVLRRFSQEDTKNTKSAMVFDLRAFVYCNRAEKR
jgi:glyoxylase-like metal-dependent hydrolase (beta-lactamase superfamily II)